VQSDGPRLAEARNGLNLAKAWADSRGRGCESRPSVRPCYPENDWKTNMSALANNLAGQRRAVIEKRKEGSGRDFDYAL